VCAHTHVTENQQGNNSKNVELNTVDTILTVVASYCVTICAPEQAIAYSTVADKEDSGEEHETTDGAGLAFQEESNQIKCHEHDMGLQQRRINGFRYQEHRNQPL